MTCLEIVLTSGDRTRGYTATFINNAAWLGGVDDRDRENIRRFAGILYDAGSRYRHGLELYDIGMHRPNRRHSRTKSGSLDVLTADRLVRRLLFHALGLIASGNDIAPMCGKAQYNRSIGDHIGTVLKDFYTNLQIPLRPFV